MSSNKFDALTPKLKQIIPEAKIAHAIAALNTKLNAKDGKTPLLVENDEYFELQINLKDPPMNASKQHRIEIPHSIYKRPGVSICLLTQDPQEQWEEFLQANQVSNVTRVLSIKKLGSDFKPFEHRRLLLKQHDLFVADKSIIPMLPKLLGKNFYQSSKKPIPVALIRGFKKQLQQARDSTYLEIPAGLTISLKIGHSSQSPQHITANIIAALPAIISYIPKKFDNVMSIYVKTTNSASLPLFFRIASQQDFTLTLEQQYEATKQAAASSEAFVVAQALKYKVSVEKYKQLKAQAKKAGLTFSKFFKAYQARVSLKEERVKAHAAAIAISVNKKAAKNATEEAKKTSTKKSEEVKKTTTKKSTAVPIVEEKKIVIKKTSASAVVEDVKKVPSAAVKRKAAPKTADDAPAKITKQKKLNKA